MTQVTGTVSQRFDNENNVVIVVNGERYSDYKGKNTPPEVREGSVVTFPMKQKGQYLNVDGKIVVGTGLAATTTAAPAQAGPATVGGVDSRQRMILRQNAVGNAVAFLTATQGDYSQTDVIAAARRFESYYDGSLDTVELTTALAQDDDIPF